MNAFIVIAANCIIILGEGKISPLVHHINKHYILFHICEKGTNTTMKYGEKREILDTAR